MDFAKEMGTKHKCPVLYVHTYCDNTTFPNYFGKRIMEQHGDWKPEGKPGLRKKCFEVWKQEKEAKVQMHLGEDVPFFSTCSIFSDFDGKGTRNKKTTQNRTHSGKF